MIKRYVGYRERDREKPWARFFEEEVRPVQAHVAQAYDGPPVETITPFEHLVDELNGAAADVETGYGRSEKGITWVACHTDMPGVTALMWDWWFGWHSSEPSRYKLWHPEAHAFSSITPKTEGYVGTTSYVDEYVGPWMMQLAISFWDPRQAGFRVGDGTTVIYGRVGSSTLPLDVGYLAHQVRPTATGSEMRSRFYLNKPGFRLPDLAQTARAVARGPFAPLKAPLPPNKTFARELLLHCGEEMNHLAQILPELHAEFADLP